VVTTRALSLAVGAAGAICGVGALLANSGGLGVIAGVLALIAGVLAFTENRNADPQQSLPSTQDEATAAHNAAVAADLASAKTEIDLSRRRIAELESALAEAEVDPVAAQLGEGEVLTDPETHLFSESYFKVALDARIASARRHLRPVAVALIDVAEGQVSGTAVAAPPERVADAIRTTIRDADTACRLTNGVFAVILEDTPENGAVWTVERVRRNLVSNHGNHTLWAGVACYPAHAFSSEEILNQSERALAAAKEWRQDRIEVALPE